MKGTEDGPTLTHRVAIGVTLGILYLPWWTAILQAPAIGRSSGVPEGLVGTLVLAGGVGGPALLFLPRIGAARKLVAVTAALLIPSVALFVGVSWWPATVFGLVALGALCPMVDASVQSAVTATLRRRDRLNAMVAIWLPKTAVMFAGGPIAEWLAGRFGLDTTFASLSAVAVLSGRLLAHLCPSPDRDGKAQGRSAAEGQAGLGWLGLSQVCAVGAMGVFAAFLPLWLAQEGVAGIGWTQVALPVGSVTIWLVSRPRPGRGPWLSPRRIAMVGTTAYAVACAGALVGALIATSATGILVVAITTNVVARIGSGLYSMATMSLGATTSRGTAVIYVGGAAGTLVFGAVGGVAWTAFAPEVRYEIVLAGALTLGLVSVLATRRWLASLGPLER